MSMLMNSWISLYIETQLLVARAWSCKFLSTLLCLCASFYDWSLKNKLEIDVAQKLESFEIHNGTKLWDP
jgi:hypothetical protein